MLEVACNAHARRKFYDARDNDPQRAHQALAYYRQLYDVEDKIREAEAQARQRTPMTETETALFRVWWDEQVVLYRQEYALPIWQQFHVYRKVPPNGEVRVRMALTGFGTVYFDNIRVEPYIGSESIRLGELPVLPAPK